MKFTNKLVLLGVSGIICSMSLSVVSFAAEVEKEVGVLPEKPSIVDAVQDSDTIIIKSTNETVELPASNVHDKVETNMEHVKAQDATTTAETALDNAETVVEPKVKALQEILQNAFDEKSESTIRIIKAIFGRTKIDESQETLNETDKNETSKSEGAAITDENIISKLENIFGVSVEKDSKIVELIKDMVELPMFEDVIADEKYKGLAVFSDEILNDSELKVITKFMTRNDCFRDGRTIDVTGIMVHSTASPGKMADFWYLPWNRSFEKGEMKREVCVHAFLDDKAVYQYLPWNHRGWHCGGKGNNYLVSFEICEPEDIVYSADHKEIDFIDVEGTRKYFEKAYNNAVKLCVMLCRQFNLTESDIVCHCEGHDLGIASNHGDVMHWWKFYNKNMDDFRADVKKALKKDKIANANQEKESVSVLNKFKQKDCSIPKTI